MPGPRTQKDFDDWLQREKGDPWGYQSDHIQDRMQKSLSFVKRKVNAGFKGTFIEFGAFDGSFTRLLSAAYPHSKIVANDISEIAVQKLRITIQNLPNVEVHCSDMLSFPDQPLNVDTSNGLIILLMECLYYLPFEEQIAFLNNLKRKYKSFLLFLSAPMKGEKYYDENTLQYLFDKSGYIIDSRRVLNYSKVPPFSRLFDHLINNSAYFRRLYANQVIHLVLPV